GRSRNRPASATPCSRAMLAFAGSYCPALDIWHLRRRTGRGQIHIADAANTARFVIVETDESLNLAGRSHFCVRPTARAWCGPIGSASILSTNKWEATMTRIGKLIAAAAPAA